MSAHPVLGAMPPQNFLDRFMSGAGRDAAPVPDFSSVIAGNSLRSMCETFVRSVERYKIFPGMRLFITKTKKQKHAPSPFGQSPSNAEGQARIDSISDTPHTSGDYYPPLAARKQLRIKRRQRKRRDLTEYFNFATCALGIEAHCSADADPFLDPPESYPPLASDQGGSTPTPLNSGSTSITFPPAHNVTISATPAGAKRRPTVSDLLRTTVSDKSNSASLVSRAEPEPHCRKPNDPSAVSASEPYTSFDNRSEEGTASRTSLISHAEAQFACQHRIFFLQLVIVNRWARFVRWDRCGAVVSRRFDYIAEPRMLAEFLWRFSHMSDEERGWDPTVSPASKKEAALFQEAVEGLLRESAFGSQDGRPRRSIPRAERSLDDTGVYPTWKIRVENSATGESTHLLVRRPFAGQHTLTGRATRAYVAYDLRHGRLLFAKDSWRNTNAKLRSEFETYQELNSHGVEHVPNVLYGGDILDSQGQPQTTSTQRLATVKEDWLITRIKKARTLVHNRIVQDLYYPLDAVIDERELAQVMCDILIAIEQAYTRAGLLHRDISMRNIMLDRNGRGVLNDWDFAGSSKELDLGIGTWAFMSVNLLEDPDKLHDVADDLEAVFWVLLYSALKRFAPPCPTVPVSIFAGEWRDMNGRMLGGHEKSTVLLRGYYKDVEFPCDALRAMIHDMGDAWADYHLSLSGIEAGTAEKALELERIRELAPKPSYWVEKVSRLLQQFPETHREPTAPGKPYEIGNSSSMSRKRKSEEIGDDIPCGLRRSKRLRAMQRALS